MSLASSKPTVVLIVDHPLRDLGGSVLIATELARQGVRTILAPMAFQQEAVFGSAPDLVLVNYIRNNNAEFIQKMFKAGIKVSLLDTEGGFYGDLSKYTKILCQTDGILEKLESIFAWGHKMHDYWVHTIGLNPQQIKLTGVARFDLYHPTWLNKVQFKMTETYYNPSKKALLFNTKVALANPQFQTLEKEKSLYKQLGFSDEEVEQIYSLGTGFINQFTELVRKTAQKFENETIILRPHPHENLQTYSSRLQDLRNVHVNRSQDLLSWLPTTKAIIHRHCTTAIEGALAGIPAISPQWVPTSSNLPDGEALSYRPTTDAEFNELISELNQKGTLPLPPGASDILQKTIHDWLYQFDGQSHRRVAAAVHQSVSQRSKVNQDLCRQFRREIYNSKVGLVGSLIQASEKWKTSAQLFQIVKKRKWKASPKSFDLDNIQSFLVHSKGEQAPHAHDTISSCVVFE